jgi:hypothetical protein
LCNVFAETYPDAGEIARLATAEAVFLQEYATSF